MRMDYGAFQIPVMPNTDLLVITADGDDNGWEHVSAHAVYRKRMAHNA